MNPHHKFKKMFGQNFLINSQWTTKLVNTLILKKNVKVIEVGPGNGIVTTELLKTGSDVYSIEIDSELVPLLINKFNNNKHFHLINSDIMKLNLDSLPQCKYVVVGSLPYNISKEIIYKFMLANNKPQNMVFIIQKEVADEYCAIKPHNTFLSNWLRLYSIPEFICKIPNTEFYPQPKVDGAIIKFELTPEKYKDCIKITKFIKHNFGQPRKKLSATLSSITGSKENAKNIIQNAGFKDTIRAAELDLEDWIRLYNLL